LKIEQAGTRPMVITARANPAMVTEFSPIRQVFIGDPSEMGPVGDGNVNYKEMNLDERQARKGKGWHKALLFNRGDLYHTPARESTAVSVLC